MTAQGLHIRETPADDPAAVALIAALDAELGSTYPAESRHGYSVAKLLAEGVRFFVATVDGVEGREELAFGHAAESGKVAVAGGGESGEEIAGLENAQMIIEIGEFGKVTNLRSKVRIREGVSTIKNFPGCLL